MDETDPYGHRPSSQICLSEATGHSVSQVTERLPDQLLSGLAASERCLSAHGFGPGWRLHRAGVDVGGKRQQLGTGRLAEQSPQDRTSRVGELADGMDPGLVEASFRSGPDAPYQPDGKRVEECALIGWGGTPPALGRGPL